MHPLIFTFLLYMVKLIILTPTCWFEYASLPCNQGLSCLHWPLQPMLGLIGYKLKMIPFLNVRKSFSINQPMKYFETKKHWQALETKTSRWIVFETGVAYTFNKLRSHITSQILITKFLWIMNWYKSIKWYRYFHWVSDTLYLTTI